MNTNILGSSDKFWRWKDGTCIFCETSKGPNDEPIQKHTFFDDISISPIITRVSYNISLIIKKSFDKIHNFKEMWEDEKKK